MRSVEQMGGCGWECHGHLSLLLVFSHLFPCEGKRVWKRAEHCQFETLQFHPGQHLPGTVPLPPTTDMVVLSYSYHHYEHICLFHNGCVR